MKKNNYIFICLSLICFILLIFFHTRGIVFSDEGYILNSAAKMFAGQLPYKNFNFVYTPGVIYLTFVGFVLFGKTILAERIIAIILSIFTLIILYKFINLFTPNKTYAWLSVFIYIAWGSSHINFIWPVMLAIPTSLLALYILKKLNHAKNSLYLLFLSITVFLTFLAKQNFGLILLFTSLIYIILNKNIRNIYTYFVFAACLAGITSIFIFYLLSTGSFLAFLQNMYRETFQRLIIGNDIGTQFLYLNGSIGSFIKTCFYLFPELLFIYCFIISLRKKDNNWYIFLFLILFYFVEIRPTTDYVHLVPILSILSIAFVYIFIHSKILYKYIIALLVLIFIFSGFYTALFKGYYRWNTPLISQNYFTSRSNIFLFLDKNDQKMITDMQNFTQKYSSKNQFIYVNEYYPLIYFVTNHKNPTFDDVISASKFYDTTRPGIITRIEKENVQVIFTNKGWETSNLGSYIGKHYRIRQETGNYYAWTKM